MPYQSKGCKRERSHGQGHRGKGIEVRAKGQGHNGKSAWGKGRVDGHRDVGKDIEEGELKSFLLSAS